MRTLNRAHGSSAVWMLGATAAFAVLSSACQLLESTGMSAGPRPKQLLLWRNGDIPLATRLAFDDSVVYVLAINHVAGAIDKRTGVTRWRVDLTPTDPSRIGAGLMLAGGHLIVGDGDLLALDLASGRQVWKYSPSIGSFPGCDKQWSDGATIVGGTPTGQIYAIDAVSGAERWITTLLADTTIKSYSPVVSGGVVFAGFTRFTPIPHLQKDGGVAALDASTGRVLWATLIPQRDSADETGVWGDPDAAVLTPAMVYTQVADDSAYGLDRQTGAILNRFPQRSSR